MSQLAFDLNPPEIPDSSLLHIRADQIRVGDTLGVAEQHPFVDEFQRCGHASATRPVGGGSPWPRSSG